MEWSFNPLGAIGIFLAFMFFGYFFGLAEGRGKGYKKRKQEEAEEPRQAPPEPVASPSLPQSDGTPVLDLSLDNAGLPLLKMDGQRVDTSTLDAGERKRLIEILTQMRPWLEAPKSTSVPESTTPPARSRPAPVSTPHLTSRPSATTPPPPSTATATVDMTAPASAPQSIVAQIDAILQVRTAGTPLAERGIRLQESLQGGVNVWVGIQKFDAIDDVPDEQAKAAIRAAIAEWEEKSAPGV